MPTKDTTKQVSDIESYFERMSQRTAKGWRPEPGTTMQGKVIGLRMGYSEYKSAENPDGAYPIVVYRVERMFKRDGSNVDHADTIALHCFHKVLRDRMKELNTKMGSEQFVTYVGAVDHNTEKDKDGKPKQYHMYDAENVGESADTATGEQEGFTFG